MNLDTSQQPPAAIGGAASSPPPAIEQDRDSGSRDGASSSLASDVALWTRFHGAHTTARCEGPDGPAAIRGVAGAPMSASAGEDVPPSSGSWNERTAYGLDDVEAVLDDELDDDTDDLAGPSLVDTLDPSTQDISRDGDTAGAAPSDGSPLPSASPQALEQLAAELGALVEAGPPTGGDMCSFELELPGMGRVQGRVSFRRDRADVELQGSTAALSAALRSRRDTLKQDLDRASDHDVRLLIA